MSTTPKSAFIVACLFGAAAISQAQTSNSIVRFSVDMSVAGPPTSTLDVRGNFNNWSGGVNLTEEGSSGIWTNTVNISSLSNGQVLMFKFVKDNVFENTADFHNRAINLPLNSGGSLNVPTPYFDDGGPGITVPVTFQVDMAQQINIGAFNIGTNLYIRGNQNGWGTTQLMTNDPTILRTNQFGLVTSNVYVGTFEATASPNAAMDYKYYFNNGSDQWESTVNVTNRNDDGNRFFTLNPGGVSNATVFYNDSAFAPVGTNTVIFRVNMQAQVEATNFNPNTDFVKVRGTFNSWGETDMFPDTVNTNVYTNVVVITDGVGSIQQYKFYSTSSIGWESPNPALSPTFGNDNNRYFNQPETSTNTLPVVYFSDQSPNDLLPVDMMVTFTVDMTGAMPTGGGPVFDPSSQTVFMNGQFVNWNNSVWNPISLAGAGLQMDNVIGTSNYTKTLTLPAGKSVQLIYKYSIDGLDNEAPSGQNHVRYVRLTKTGAYTLPGDKFGNQYGEPSFGQLSSLAAGGGGTTISWLGRPGVNLQSKDDVTGAVWVNLIATDGTNWTTGATSTNGFVSQTNYPASGQKYFRLVKPY